MNKTDIKLIAVSAFVAILIAGGTAFAFIASFNNTSVQMEMVSEAVKDDKNEVEEIKKDEDRGKENQSLPDYESIYLDYMKGLDITEEGIEYFSRGILLCDLNDDGIPELFSYGYDGNLYLHEFKDNSVIEPSEETAKTFIDDMYAIMFTPTFFEDPENFFGIYKNKQTGQKALINSIADGSENDRFDIITYSDEGFILKDEGVKVAVNNSWPINEKRDSVMSDYELANDEIYKSYLLRGVFGGEYGSDPVEALKGLIDDFKKSETITQYKAAPDGEFDCYIKNMTENEIVLIPAASITYQEFTEAINADEMYTVNGEEMKIIIDEFLVNEYGIAHLYEMPWFEYEFSIPTEEYPESIIEGYMGNEPVRAEIDKNTRIRYGVGEYNSDGTPEYVWGSGEEYMVSEYLPHFAEYSFVDNLYRATVKNGKLIFLDVMYHD